MAEYPAELEFDVVLRDGGVVRLRPIRPDDAPALHRFFGRVGPESVYQRFFRIKRDLTPEELTYFTTLDYRNRMAFVAVHAGEIIGVGRYELIEEGSSRRPGARMAEVAFLVEDEHQGRGIGTQLLQHLTAYARRHDISAFEAFVLADNHAMLRVFRSSGYQLQRELTEGIYTVEFPIQYAPEAREVDWEHEKRAVAASIMPIFYPHSVAVIGASRDPSSIGGRLVHNLVAGGFAGPVYPVNPEARVIHSVRAYPTVLDIRDPVDLAFVAVSAQHVNHVVRQCGEKGVKGVVVISAGFSETGDNGRLREEELREIVRSSGMRMVGPNCMGVLNTDPKVSLDGQFGSVFPPAGNVAMSSQSGALGLAILDYARELGVGISTFVSVGNKADVSGNDLLLYWEEDPTTDVILLYLESFGNPRRFGRLARRIGLRKPIVAVKSGRSSAGARAALSHTGSLASVDVAVDALFHQSGVIRTDTLEELFDVAALLANQPLPEGNRVAVLTNAGGPGILAADALEANGLELPELSASLQVELAAHLPGEASTGNPVDMIAAAGPSEYSECLAALLASEEIDSVIVIHIPVTPSASGDVAAAIGHVFQDEAQAKPVLSVFMRSEGAPEELTGIPVYPFPERAAKALGAAAQYAEWRSGPEGDFEIFDDIDAEASDCR